MPSDHAQHDQLVAIIRDALVADEAAAGILDTGYRRVSADDATVEAAKVDAVRARADFVDQYCTRRANHREGDFTPEQYEAWQREATDGWTLRYPGLAAIAAVRGGEA
jgi:hypothetical protein